MHPSITHEVKIVYKTGHSVSFYLSNLKAWRTLHDKGMKRKKFVTVEYEGGSFTQYDTNGIEIVNCREVREEKDRKEPSTKIPGDFVK